MLIWKRYYPCAKCKGKPGQDRSHAPNAHGKCKDIFNKRNVPKRKLVFPSGTGNPISCSWIRNAFLKCIQYIGIAKPDLPKHSRNICLHCLRHSFAVAAFRQLDNSGLDMYNEIPILSTYMGHENLYGTEHYLHMTA